MPRQAIRREGEGAEQEFFRLVAGARPSDSAKLGDAMLPVDGENCYVEIKYVTSNTVNQIRAVKLIPLVIYSPSKTLPWAVLSGADVVRAVYEKNRGQHSELALECSNLSLSSLPDRIRCSDDALGDAVLAAIRAARRYPELRSVLDELLSNLETLKSEYRSKVAAALEAGDRR